MKIFFICGSLEPGHDGVGDYTRRFAGELIRLGNQIAIISVNDYWIDQFIAGTQDSDGIAVPMHRIPSAWPEKKRFHVAGGLVNKFDPEWISLQFVPFAYNQKGLPFSLIGNLVKIGKGRRWHIMFHELWVGMNKESPIKHFWWGWLQRRLIVLLIKKVKPLIHTQSQLYLEQLKKLGFKANYLPLFSNISVIEPIFREGKQISESREHPEKISFVLFAAIHAGAPAMEFARDVALFCSLKGIETDLIIIGRNSSEKARWASAWQAEGMNVEMMGEQSPDCISTILSNASVGITTTPFAIVEKSGAVAAMREHGLPVICVSYDWTPRGIKGFKLPDGIVEYPQWDIASFLSGKRYTGGQQKIEEIASSFINALI